MAKKYVCPRCNGDGCKHRIESVSEADCVEECPECGSTGVVTKARRQELLEWAARCRQRGGPTPLRSPGADR